MDLELERRELVRLDPVMFDSRLAEKVESAAGRLKLRSKRLFSGAGHDAQMMQRICPSIMIFVPSHLGISHNPNEYSSPQDIQAGVDVLANSVLEEILG